MYNFSFTYTRPPKLSDLLTIGGIFGFAVFFTVATLNSTHDTFLGSATDGGLITFLALASILWGAVAALGQGLWRRYRAYRDSEPALSIDNRGITIPSWTGRPTNIAWGAVTGIYIARIDREDVLIVELARSSGRIPLRDLNATSEEILRAAQKCSGRTF